MGGDAGTHEKKRSKVRKAAKLVSFGLLGWAVVEELRKPKDERTWTGSLAGFVPYDLRPPNVERIKDAYWAPENERIFTPRPMGVGWAVNVGRVVRLASSKE